MDQGLYAEVAQHGQKVWEVGTGLLPGGKAGAAAELATRWAEWGLSAKLEPVSQGSRGESGPSTHQSTGSCAQGKGKKA